MTITSTGGCPSRRSRATRSRPCSSGRYRSSRSRSGRSRSPRRRPRPPCGPGRSPRSRPPCRRRPRGSGHPVVVVDDHDADHGVTGAPCRLPRRVRLRGAGAVPAATSRQPGSTAVNTAPPSWPTLTMPPRRSVICRTRARPRPAPRAGRRGLAGEPVREDGFPHVVGHAGPGVTDPDHQVRRPRRWSAPPTAACRAWAVASIALSIRFPVTVSTAVTSVRSASTWQSSATRSWTPRSSASEDLARVSATSLGSRIPALSCSVSASRGRPRRR